MIRPRIEYHPLSELFPLMDGAEFAALYADIRAHGQREPIILHEGKILDGRNRYRVCMEAGLTPVTKEWDGEGSAQAFVVSKNLHRRHLNASQRAIIAARLAPMTAGDIGIQREKLGAGIPTAVLSATQAGELLNVSRDSIVAAKQVLRSGTPEDIEAIETGRAAVSTIADRIRAKGPSRQKPRALAQSGRNPERIQRQQINAEVWGHFRDALTHLGSLPLPADAVAIVRANDRTGLVESRLAQSLKWLEDFAHEWRNRDQAAA